MRMARLAVAANPHTIAIALSEVRSIVRLGSTAGGCHHQPIATASLSLSRPSPKHRMRVGDPAGPSLSPYLKPVGREEVAPPEPEPISKRRAIAFRFPPSMLERDLGSPVHARKRHLDFRAVSGIEGAAPP